MRPLFRNKISIYPFADVLSRKRYSSVSKKKKKKKTLTSLYTTIVYNYTYNINPILDKNNSKTFDKKSITFRGKFFLYEFKIRKLVTLRMNNKATINI